MKTRTSSPARCAWMAPVELPLDRRRTRRRERAATDSALAASIGWTGRITCRWMLSSAASSRARGGRSHRDRRSTSARRTSASGSAAARDRIGHHALERALAQLAEQEPPEEASLGLRRGRTARRDARGGRRSSPRGRARDLGDQSVDLEHRQGGHRRRRPPRSCAASPIRRPRGPANRADEEPDRDPDLLGGEAAEEDGQRLDLRGPRPRRRGPRTPRPPGRTASRHCGAPARCPSVVLVSVAVVLVGGERPLLEVLATAVLVRREQPKVAPTLPIVVVDVRTTAMRPSTARISLVIRKPSSGPLRAASQKRRSGAMPMIGLAHGDAT